jgi:antirestriction protein ArdC
MKIIDKIVDQVISSLENGAVPWRKTWKYVPPMNAFSKYVYQGFNPFLLSAVCSEAGYSYPLFGTFKQITEAGGRIKKGARSTPIVYWKISSEETEDEATGEKEIKNRFTPFYYSVFNLEQSEGIDIQEYVSEYQHPDNHSLDVCETVIDNMPHPPRMVHDDCNSAFYRPSADLVNIPADTVF